MPFQCQHYKNHTTLEQFWLCRTSEAHLVLHHVQIIVNLKIRLRCCTLSSFEYLRVYKNYHLTSQSASVLNKPHCKNYFSLYLVRLAICDPYFMSMS